MQNSQRPTLRIFSALVLATLLLAGCGGGGPLTVVLPRIEVNFDADGNPTIAGINPMLLTMFGVPVEQLPRLDKATVAQITDSNIQHAELVFRQDGLYWWVNSKALIPLVWDDASFNNVTQLIPKFVQMDEAQKGALANVFLPAARRLELNVLIRFPLKSGAAEVPVREMRAALPVAGAPTTPSTVARLHISFDPEGTPSIVGVSLKEIGQIIGADTSSVAIPKDTVNQMVAAGIQHVTVRTTPEGVKMWTNDQPLPTLRWSDETLKSTAEVVGGLTMLPPALAELIAKFLPAINTLDINLVLKFPTNGAAPIPLP
jgi:predicted small lipoprotein YifL